MSVFKNILYICYMKHSIVRETIIATASELFYQKGYNLTGINEIIKEAGIAKATLYNHFQSKDDICIAYLQNKNEGFLDGIGEFAQKAKMGRDQLLALFDFLTQFFDSKDFNGCWCINTVSEIPKSNERIRAEIQVQKRQFIKMIEELAFNNYPENTEKENETLAAQVYVLYEGAISESFLHQDPWPIESAKSICDHILP